MPTPGKKLHFFISHASKDADYAKWLDGVLRAAGHHTTTQEYDFPVGRSFLDLMMKAADACDHILALYSPNFFASAHARSEIFAALSSDGLNQNRKLIPVRIAPCEIAALLSHFIYADIVDKTEAEAIAEIFRAIHPPPRGHAPYPGPQPAQPRISVASLPTVDPTLIGRETELALLHAAWTDPAVNFFQIVAPGGTGKTALMSKWYKSVSGATIFGWSFYSQGTGETSQTSSDPFFEAALAFFSVAPQATGPYAKAEALARHLAQHRALLILDGIEPLQEISGRLPDTGLVTLLKELAAANAGLVLCTTRVRLIDIPDDEPRARSRDLDNLSPDDGVRYLRHFEIEGTDEELRQASIDFGNRALALTLLGTYLAEFCRCDIRRRTDPVLIGPALDQGQQAHRAMAAYVRMYQGKPELDVLRALSYFDRPAEPDALKLVLPKMDAKRFQGALTRLKKARLVLDDDPAKPIDCHPLIREHFAWVMRTTELEAFRDGHSRLYEHYSKKAPHQPNTLKEMTPLFYAVYHGCQAGKHEEACNNVYYDRIRRGNEAYLVHKLGAFGTDLSLLANFFESPWVKPVTALSLVNQAWVINSAAFALRALGRLSDAIEPMMTGAEADERREDWKNAAIAYGNLSDLHLTLGNISEAIATARQSVDFADRSADAFQRLFDRTTRAAALHQSGDLAAAARLFEEAERLQAERQPQYPILYSLQGYRYCDLLLDQGQTAEALRRATQTLVIAERNHWLLDIGLDHLTLARAGAPGNHLDQAVDHIRQAGTLDMLPLALLARATDRDLDEAFRIATRSGMRLYLADYHLLMARRHRDPDHLAKAEALIAETGYHRRDREAAEIHQLLAGSPA